MRHGEAGAAPRDFERPLTTAGEAMAANAQQHASGQGVTIQKILCSPAIRTRMTCENFTKGLPQKPEVEFVENFYGASPEMVMETLQHEEAETVLVIGHNPWVHALVLMLATRASLSPWPQIKSAYPPASLAILRFNGPVAKGAGELTDYYAPPKSAA